MILRWQINPAILWNNSVKWHSLCISFLPLGLKNLAICTTITCIDTDMHALTGQHEMKWSPEQHMHRWCVCMSYSLLLWISIGCKVNQVNSQGQHPLMAAVMSRSHLMVCCVIPGYDEPISLLVQLAQCINKPMNSTYWVIVSEWVIDVLWMTVKEWVCDCSLVFLNDCSWVNKLGLTTVFYTVLRSYQGIPTWCERRVQSPTGHRHFCKNHDWRRGAFGET